MKWLGAVSLLTLFLFLSKTVLFLSQDDLKEEEEEKKANVKLEPGQIHDKRSKLDSLNYIENFTNPYVRLMVVCKICGKEQSLSHSRYWREHFKTHNKEQAHKVRSLVGLSEICWS